MANNFATEHSAKMRKADQLLIQIRAGIGKIKAILAKAA